jgi:hypothetical protein
MRRPVLCLLLGLLLAATTLPAAAQRRRLARSPMRSVRPLTDFEASKLLNVGSLRHHRAANQSNGVTPSQATVPRKTALPSQR